MEIIINEQILELLNRKKAFKEIFLKKFSELEKLKNYEKYIYEAKYYSIFGNLETEYLETTISLRYLKRKVARIQLQINLNEKINLQEIEIFLNEELNAYYIELENFKKKVEFQNKINGIKDYLNFDEVKELKEKYRILAKKLHPDFNPNISKKEKEYWNLVLEAYNGNDLETLKNIYEIFENYEVSEIKDYNIESLEAEIMKIENKINEKTEEYNNLIKTYPYYLKNLLKDEEWIKKNELELKEKINQDKKNILAYENYIKSLMGSDNSETFTTKYC